MNKVGLIVNPKAGQGFKKNLEIAQKVLAGLRPTQVTTGPGVFGGDAVPDASIIDIPKNTTGRKITQWLAAQFTRQGVDVIVIIGGDGTMADVAFILVTEGKSCPILGVGAGSVNAGKLITCRKDQLDSLVGTKFEIKEVDALVTGYGNKDLAVAFNDVVISNTVVGTVGGQLCDLDAGSFISGKIVRQRPQSVGTTSSFVVKRAAGREVTIAKGAQVGTVIVGFAYQGYMGKAIVGGICLAALEGFPAGCLVSEQPLVRFSFDATDMDDYEPLRTVYVNLLADETIQVTGMETPAVLCADGNPIKQLGKGDLVHIRVLPKAVGVLRIVTKKN